MFNARFAAAFLSLASFAGLVGCGGHGEGFRVGSNPIVIQTTALPAINSGEILNFALQFTGGGGGPYLLEVIDGALPAGVALDNGTVGLVGRPLENGVFDFTIKLTDTGTQPFATTTQSYRWVIGIGALVFVTDADLPDWLFNGFSAAQLVVAGGTPPYTCEVVDDPNNPIDEPLPAGLSVPTDSCTIVGAPTGVKSSAPFVYKVSIRATDANLQVVTKEFTVSVLVPPIIIVTANLPNGKCGTAYAASIALADGIPPFNHTVVDAVNSTSMLLGEPGTPGGVAKGTPLSAYELDATVGPYTGKFPEGIVLRQTDGNLSGVPHRVGTFSNWNYRANSTVLPTVPSQNAWKTYTFAMADSSPPVVVLDPLNVLASGSTYSATLVAATAPGASNFLIRSPELGVGFNPLQFKATGGVAQDGKYDAPHSTQAANNPAEAVGAYNWASTTFVSGLPPGMTFSSTGIFAGTPTAPSGFQVMNPVARDAQLPSPGSASHTGSGFCRFDIGPDTVVITETSSGSSATLNDLSMEFPSQRVEILEPKTGLPVVRALSDTLDMARTHTHPLGGSNTLDSSLTSIDFLRVSVNPTWWAYDAYNANALGARSMQHGDSERFTNSQDLGGDTAQRLSYARNTAASVYPEGMEHASNPAIELPEARGASPFNVTHNPAAGVYADGGLLYGYDKSNEFGFFIVRKDSKIQIPVAFTKSTFAGFGDAWISSSSSRSGMFRIPQITVSPDGRMAAAKLKISVDNFAETVSAGEKVVVFSLTGEKPFAGATFVVLSPGGTDGTYLYADSLTLTNHALYALRGNNRGDLGDRVIYGDHYVYRAAIFNPTSGAYLTPTTLALLNSGFGGGGSWTNSAGSPISVTYCKWATQGTDSLPASGFVSSYNNTTATPENNSPSQLNPEVVGNSWANFSDNGSAPTAFRVSANGMACAIIAGGNGTAAAVGTTTFLKRSIYVDFNQQFNEAAVNTRRYKPAARLVGGRYGEQQNFLWGAYDGPATQFEISDDGTKLAVVYNASTQAWQNRGDSQANLPDSYEAVCALTSTGASSSNPWTTKTETLVTHPASTIFVTSVQWRMGSIAFTRDNKAFVFWAGFGLQNPDTFSQSYADIGMQSGSLYAYTFGSTTVDGILPFAQGGHADVTGATKTYSSSTQVTKPTSGFSYAGNGTAFKSGGGSTLPIGAFFSNDGNFYYFNSLGATSSSDPSASRLVGVNVKDTSSTINTRVALQAFVPSWVVQRGFTNGTYAYPCATVRGRGGPRSSVGNVVTAAGNTAGLLFFNAERQQNSGKQDWTGPSGGGPNNNSYWGDYGHYDGEMYAIATSVGGNLIPLSNIAAPSSTGRVVGYMQPNRAGSRLAFVSRASVSSTNSYGFATYNGAQNPAAEQLRIVSNISVSSSGALSGTPAVAILESTPGRVSSSIALDFSDRKIYYGFSSTSNENGMKIQERTLDGAGAVIAASNRSFNGIGGTSNRFAVLWSGR